MEYDSNREIFYHQTISGFTFNISEIWYLTLILAIQICLFLYSIIGCTIQRFFFKKSHKHQYFQVKTMHDIEQVLDAKYYVSERVYTQHKPSKVTQDVQQQKTSQNPQSSSNQKGKSKGNQGRDSKGQKGQGKGRGQTGGRGKGSLQQQEEQRASGNAGFDQNVGQGREIIGHIYKCHSCGYKVNDLPM